MISVEWSAEEATEAQRAFEEAGGDSNDPAGPVYQWAGLHDIERQRARFEAGDGFAILHAVAICALRELVMPEWVIRGFLDRYRSVTHYKVKSLDEAFGFFLPKGAKLPAHRQKREKSLIAYFEVRKRSEAGESIGPELFHSVGEGLHLGASKVRDYFYDWQRAMTYKKIPE